MRRNTLLLTVGLLGLGILFPLQKSWAGWQSVGTPGVARSTDIVAGANYTGEISTLGVTYLESYTILSTGSWNNKVEVYDGTQSSQAIVDAGNDYWTDMPTEDYQTVPLDITCSSGTKIFIKDDLAIAGETVKIRLRWHQITLHNP